jgi:hypothetical protein
VSVAQGYKCQLYQVVSASCIRHSNDALKAVIPIHCLRINRFLKCFLCPVPLRDVMGEKNLEGIPVDSGPSPNVPLQVIYIFNINNTLK